MIKTQRLFLVPNTLPMLEAIVSENWGKLSSCLGGVDFAEQWFQDLEVFVWLHDFATDHPIDLNWWNYLIIHQQDVRLIGTCGYKGAPGPDGKVEIGYEIAPKYRNQKFATEAAAGLCQHAFSFESVTGVCAHTLAEENPSVQLLRKLEFQFVQEMIDIEDGKIWEWVKMR